jgi:hypothetical protein
LAGLGAGLHHGVVAHALAVFGALGADFGAFAAEVGMVGGHSGHEIGAGLANLDAVHHEADVRGGGVGAALLQAVAYGFEAGFMTGLTVLDALPHFLVHLLHGGLWLIFGFRAGG